MKDHGDHEIRGRLETPMETYTFRATIRPVYVGSPSLKFTISTRAKTAREADDAITALVLREQVILALEEGEW